MSDGHIHQRALFPSPLRGCLARAGSDSMSLPVKPNRGGGLPASECSRTQSAPLLNPPRKGEEANSNSGSSL